MSPIRKKRVESSILRELAQLLIRYQTKDDRIEFVSVHKVDLSRDGSHAKLYLSFFGSPEDNELCCKAIQEKLGLFQSIIGRNLGLRFTPRFRLFVVDQALQESFYTESE